jgi:hypothetical protein
MPMQRSFVEHLETDVREIENCLVLKLVDNCAQKHSMSVPLGLQHICLKFSSLE